MTQENGDVCRRIERGSRQVSRELDQAHSNGDVLASRRLDMEHIRDEIQRNIIEAQSEIARCAASLRPATRKPRGDTVIIGRAVDCVRQLITLQSRLAHLRQALAVANERLRNMDTRIAENARSIQQKERVLVKFSEQKREQ